MSVEGVSTMELHEALTEIAAIRRQIALAEQFRGYRALPVALGAGTAFAAVLAQPLLVPDPLQDFFGYLKLWISVAAVAGLLPVIDVCARHRVCFGLEAGRSL